MLLPASVRFSKPKIQPKRFKSGKNTLPDNVFQERFSSQIRLPHIGLSGQEKLFQAKILVVGAGTLGCACLPWLVASGIGEIRLVDPDRIEPDNLARQVLYTEAELGQNKALSAKTTLQRQNPHLNLIAETQYATRESAQNWIKKADLVLDCADNVATSFLLDDLCRSAGKIFVSASAERFGGYVGAFNGNAPAYRNIFPALNEGTDCATSGILGAAGGVIGALQAQITISLILGLDPSPLGKLFVWKGDEWRMETIIFYDAPIKKTENYPVISLKEITANDLLIDLRPKNSWPKINNALRELPKNLSPEQQDHRRIIFLCETGALATKEALEHQERGYRNLALCALNLEENL
ncbi:HesA/MoeB/ThiF family protein [Acetobacteraceae bacterium]|nr:HesA/MoeB/ThiF family protein [Acetobacteraceae bacterium]